LRLIQIALNRGAAEVPIGIDVREVDAFTKGTLNKVKLVEAASLDDLRNTAQSLIGTTRANAVRDTAFILAALAIALLLMLMVSRLLLKPLRILRRDALDVASRRLPNAVQRILADPNPLEASKNAVDPVPVFTTEEVGQVARSFDVVQQQAVRMATEQAMLRDNINSIFVNLSRRSQTLVERQLALIDLLERDEEDPDQLAHLFELDHLATRMRRNSESLLVLSGNGLSRQMSRPVPAEEVVGAAISEVEQYKRIIVTSAPDVQVRGVAVSDLVHLIAELLDNATYFSGPDQDVRVRMVATRAQDLVIQITDNGVGMSEAEIRVANERLANPPDLDVAVTRRMGLYVVARLAKKYSILVRLRENEDLEGGLITRITVPSELITYSRSSTATRPAALGNGARRATGAVAQPPRPIPTHSGNGHHPVLSTVDFVPPADFGPTGEVVPNEDFGPAGGAPNGNGWNPAIASLFDDPRLSSAGQNGNGATPEEQPEPPAENRTQRLPIYEEVLSQWFSPDPEPRDRPATTNGEPAPEPPAWRSAGDDGWQAARTVLTNGEHALNDKGLPKRVPKARLMPGSAAPRHELKSDVAPADERPKVVLPQRNAGLTRGRMSSLQQGLRRGRTVLTGEAIGTDEDQQKEQQQ
jgi:signal transduction histidine kinase